VSVRASSGKLCDTLPTASARCTVMACPTTSTSTDGAGGGEGRAAAPGGVVAAMSAPQSPQNFCPIGDDAPHDADCAMACASACSSVAT